MTYAAVATPTMVKEAGTRGAAYDTVRPAHIEPTERATDMAIAFHGLLLSSWAAAAGAARRPRRRSEPTAWVASPAVTPTRARKPMPSDRTGTPVAEATESSREEKRR